MHTLLSLTHGNNNPTLTLNRLLGENAELFAQKKIEQTPAIMPNMDRGDKAK